MLCMDNGLEFISLPLTEWAEMHAVRQIYLGVAA